MRKPWPPPSFCRSSWPRPAVRPRGGGGRVWRDAAASFAEVTSDTLGTSFARVRAGEGAPTLALDRAISTRSASRSRTSRSNGLLSFTTIGGIGAETLLGQRVELLTRDGRVTGVDRPQADRAASSCASAAVSSSTDLHIDIGATSREEAEALVRVGDAGVWGGAPVELPNGRLLSKALDNRLGAYVALEVGASHRRGRRRAGRRRRGRGRAGGDRPVRRAHRGLRRSTRRSRSRST